MEFLRVKQKTFLRMAIEAKTSRSQLIKIVVIHVLFISLINILLIMMEYMVKSALQKIGAHMQSVTPTPI
jgi:hypothetical protein